MNATRMRWRMSRARFGGALLALLAGGAALVAVPAEAAPTKPARGDACGSLIAKPSGGTWRCTFVDNFDGTSLDTGKWAVQDSSLTGFYMGDTCFSNDGGRMRIRGGLLQLSVVREEQAFECKTPYGSFTTRYRGADLSTWGRFSQTYGRFEARIKHTSSTSQGVHNGFWMNPQDSVYGGWPNSGEIDVAEWFSSRPDHAHPSLHYPGRTWDDTGWTCQIGRPDVFHTYRLEWTSTVMKFFYDGQLCYSRSWTPEGMTAPQPFDQRFYLSLTQATGSKDFANAPLAETTFPQTMTVDYVKAWS